ncbi:hypothetical protein PIB30_118155 [Stylosanthes scabra]|uniref:Uncharacterized protein n=1 Tax=Stylosanthes scabra TaxID=79078 RepID=A0ABU6T211_9FABA|nr:hypothetical protein [Stylosanthes scabra]
MTKTTTVSTSLHSTYVRDCVIVFHWIIQLGQNWRYPLFCFLQEVLQIKQCCLTLVLVNECCSYTSLATSSCSTNPMDIIFDFGWHVVVDDMLNIWKIQTFGCNISCYQHIFLSRLKSRNGILPLFLILASMNSHCFNPFQEKILMNVINISLILTEYQNGRWGFL